jgi:hypothetical protein
LRIGTTTRSDTEGPSLTASLPACFRRGFGWIAVLIAGPAECVPSRVQALMAPGNRFANGLIFSRKLLETVFDVLDSAWHAVNIHHDCQNFQHKFRFLTSNPMPLPREARIDAAHFRRTIAAWQRNPPSQEEVQQIYNTLNYLIGALKR